MQLIHATHTRGTYTHTQTRDSHVTFDGWSQITYAARLEGKIIAFTLLTPDTKSGVI